MGKNWCGNHGGDIWVSDEKLERKGRELIMKPHGENLGIKQKFGKERKRIGTNVEVKNGYFKIRI